MLRNFLREIYSNKKPKNNALDATIVRLDSGQTTPTDETSTAIPSLAMEITLDRKLFNESDSMECLFSALNPKKEVLYSELMKKGDYLSIFLKETFETPKKESNPNVRELQQEMELESFLNTLSSEPNSLQDTIITKLQRLSKTFQHPIYSSQQTSPITVSQLFNTAKNKPALIFQFKQTQNSYLSSFHTIHLNKEFFNVLEQNPTDFQSIVTIKSLHSGLIKVQSKDYLIIMDYIISSLLDFKSSSQRVTSPSERFDLHLTTPTGKDIELEMSLIAFRDQTTQSTFFLFEGLKVKENCVFSSPVSTASVFSRIEPFIEDTITEPSLRKHLIKNDKSHMQRNYDYPIEKSSSQDTEKICIKA